MSGDHNVAQEPEGIEKLAQNAAVLYYRKMNLLSKVHDIIDETNTMAMEGRIIHLTMNVYKDAWLQGFTAKLSGAKEDE